MKTVAALVFGLLVFPGISEREPRCAPALKQLDEEAQRPRGPARSVRAAQRKMIRAGDWRSNPRYSAAYFSVGGRL
ncbi:MAG: hypothetical protein ABSC23_17000 [Bryobacteraceae bacterium]